MFSRTCEYAIRALIYVAQKSKENTKCGIKEIAKGIDSPEYFIAKILQDLVRKRMLKSMKGPNGGFYLEEKDLNTSLADVVKEIDGDKLFTRCALGLRNCSNQFPCPLHEKYKFVRHDIKIMLETSVIGDFAEQLDSDLAFLKSH